MSRRTFAARIDSSRSVIQDSARAASRAFESASEILVRIAQETSVGFFFGKWEGTGKAMPQQTCRGSEGEAASPIGNARSETPKPRIAVADHLHLGLLAPYANHASSLLSSNMPSLARIGSLRCRWPAIDICDGSPGFSSQLFDINGPAWVPSSSRSPPPCLLPAR